MKKILIILICLLLFIPTLVLAHPGRTDASGCHTCRTNCAKWGLSNGEYHCHGGSKNSTSSSKNTVKTTKEKIKSSDNTLKSISIDGESIKINDTMKYSSFNEDVDIKIETNDSKAKYDFKNRKLDLDDNIFMIKVTAENGAVKYYTLIVKREKLSNNTNIKVKINDKNINFNKDNANINVSCDTENINYEVITEDKNTKVDIQKEDKLNFGDNNVVFNVTAQDGTTKKYNVNIHRLSEKENNNDRNKLFGVIILTGLGLFTYNKYKKISNY